MGKDRTTLTRCVNSIIYQDKMGHDCLYFYVLQELRKSLKNRI